MRVSADKDAGSSFTKREKLLPASLFVPASLFALLTVVNIAIISAVDQIVSIAAAKIVLVVVAEDPVVAAFPVDRVEASIAMKTCRG